MHSLTCALYIKIALKNKQPGSTDQWCSINLIFFPEKSPMIHEYLA